MGGHSLAETSQLPINYDVVKDVSQTCSACHGLRYLDRAQGYDTSEEWSHLITSMVSLPRPRLLAISEYLATQYPHKPNKAPRNNK